MIPISYTYGYFLLTFIDIKISIRVPRLIDAIIQFLEIKQLTKERKLIKPKIHF